MGTKYSKEHWDALVSTYTGKRGKTRVSAHEMGIIWADMYIQDLTKQLSARDEAIKLLLSFAPKDCPEGLDPTFYFTLTYAGDKEIQDRIDGIRAALPQEGNDE